MCKSVNVYSQKLVQTFLCGRTLFSTRLILKNLWGHLFHFEIFLKGIILLIFTNVPEKDHISPFYLPVKNYKSIDIERQNTKHIKR